MNRPWRIALAALLLGTLTLAAGCGRKADPVWPFDEPSPAQQQEQPAS